MSGERFRRNGEPATAAEWYVAVDSAAPDDVKAARFAAWLDRAAEHEPELERCAAAVEIARSLADDPDLRFAYDEVAAQAAGAPRARRSFRNLASAAAIAATIVAGVVAIWLVRDVPAPHAAAPVDVVAGGPVRVRAADIGAAAPASVPALVLPSGVVVDAGAVAVLPFVAPPEDGVATANLAATLARGVRAELAAAPGIYVIGTRQTVAYLGTDLSASELGAQLGVRGVVVGDVALDAGQVRVGATLVDAATDQTLWHSDYERPVAKLDSLADEIGAEVAASLVDADLRARAAAAGSSFRDARAEYSTASVQPAAAFQ
jgi:TolB-like protein